MALYPIDWLIVIASVTICTAAAIYTRRYTKSISGFLAAERTAGRYLISVAMGMAMMSVITLVNFFEQYYDIGYNAIWWPLLEGPVLVLMAVTGWVVYRFRQTRALTLAQFFEMRYSKSFRVFAGMIAFLAGIVNFGIFPAVEAKFFIWFCNFGSHFTVLGISIPTFPLVMAIIIGLSMLFTFLGGQIAIIVTNFIQGFITFSAFLVVIFYLFSKFGWTEISQTLIATPTGKSLTNPFDMGLEKNFNPWFFVIGIVFMFYGSFAWQGTAGYNSAAKSPHESKMAMMLAHWRFRVLMVIALIIPICIHTFLQQPVFAEKSAQFKAQLAQNIPDYVKDPANPTPEEKKFIEVYQSQARAPMFIRHMLPKGMLGLFLAAMIAASLSTFSAYLHSWGSIFVQDVILPFRKKALSYKQHILLLRLSIFGVAAFIIIFSLVFRQTQRVAMYCALSANTFISGAGVAIIGGLYWKRGTNIAAWFSMALGVILTIIGFWMEQKGANIAIQLDAAGYIWLADSVVRPISDMTGQVKSFWIVLTVIGSYIAISLARNRKFDMDWLLRKGKYAIEGDASTAKDKSSEQDTGRVRSIKEFFGFTGEFTRADKIVTAITVAWPLLWFGVFLVGTFIHLKFGISKEAWVQFWHIWTWTIVIASVFVTIWFLIGGTIDLLYLFRKLRSQQADETDDGRVIRQDRTSPKSIG